MARWRRWVALSVFVLTCAVFLPAVRGGFVMIDDPVYVTTNALVRGGLTLDGVRRAFVTPVAELWLPVSLLSHMLDVSVWGLDPAGHHLTNVLLHALNAALVFLLWEALTGAPWPSLVVALLFALHPLRIESVAWITERKDLLSACFALLTVDAYRRWVGSPTPARLVGLCGLFTLGLLSKPMLVTIPLLLLLLDVWPLARTGVGWRRLLCEKMPLFALACAAVWTTMEVARGAQVSFEALPLSVRLGNAAVSYVRYLGAMAWPSGLAVYYPFPPPWPVTTVAAATVLTASLGGAALVLRARAPYLAVGYAWYLVALLPVAGVVQAGMQARADRFTYLPSIGILVALVWGGRALVERHRALRGPVVACVAAAAVACAVTSRFYLGFWRDDHALFERALAVTERNWFIHGNYGDTLLFEGKLDEAAAHYEQALALEPRTPTVHNRLGTVRLRRGDLDAATEEFTEALREQPDFEEAAHNLARTLEAKGVERQAALATAGALRAGLLRSVEDVGRPQGRGYQQRLVGVLWEQRGDVVARCRTDLGPAPPFELFVTVAADGAVSEAAGSPRSPLADCVASGVVQAQLPAPPFAPFHAWLTMRLGA